MLELSFRPPATRQRQRRAAPDLPVFAPPQRPALSVSEEQLQAELRKTSEMLQNAREQLRLERWQAAQAVQAAEKATAEMRHLGTHMEYYKAELARERERKRDALGPDRGLIVSTLSMQRDAMQHEMAQSAADESAQMETYVQTLAERDALKEEISTKDLECLALEESVSSLTQQLRSAQAQLEEAVGANERRQGIQRAAWQTAERESRVETLHQQAMRRIGRLGLARGLSAWTEAYWSVKRQRQLLSHCAVRMWKAKMVEAFDEWQAVWYETGRKGSMAHADAERRAEVERRTALEEEVAHLRATFETQLASRVSEAVEAHRRASDEAAGVSAERKLTQLHEQAVRRLSSLGTARALRAWHEAVLECHYRQRLLQRVGARLVRPRQAAAFAMWWALRQEAMERKLSQRREEEKQAFQRHLEEEIARGKEAHLEQLRQIAVRRIMQQALAKGWSAWHELWSRAVSALRGGRRFAMHFAMRGLLAGWNVRVRVTATVTVRISHHSHLYPHNAITPTCDSLPPTSAGIAVSTASCTLAPCTLYPACCTLARALSQPRSPRASMDRPMASDILLCPRCADVGGARCGASAAETTDAEGGRSHQQAAHVKCLSQVG